MAVKQKTVKKRASRPRPPSPPDKRRGRVAKLAAEIRNQGENWQNAMKRAGEQIRATEGKIKRRAEKAFQKFTAKNPETTKGTTPRVDAKIIAKPKGWRISKDGNRYYESRNNRSDKNRKRYPYLELGGMLKKKLED